MTGETVRLSTAGPFSPQYTREVAAAAAEAIRVLNHATLPYSAAGLAYPADVAAVTESLATAAQRLPQLLDQLRQWLAGELAAGRLEVTYGPHAGDPSAAFSAASRRLRDASAIAERLHAALHDAASVTGTISGGPVDDEEA